MDNIKPLPTRFSVLENHAHKKAAMRPYREKPRKRAKRKRLAYPVATRREKRPNGQEKHSQKSMANNYRVPHLHIYGRT